MSIPPNAKSDLWYNYFPLKEILNITDASGVLLKEKGKKHSKTNAFLFGETEKLIRNFPFKHVPIKDLTIYKVQLLLGARSGNLRLRNARYSVLYEYAYHMKIKQPLLNEMAKQGLFVFEDYDKSFLRQTNRNLSVLRLYSPDNDFGRFHRFLGYFENFANRLKLDCNEQLLEYFRNFPAQRANSYQHNEPKIGTRQLFAQNLRHQYIGIPNSLKPKLVDEFRRNVNNWYMHVSLMANPRTQLFQVL